LRADSSEEGIRDVFSIAVVQYAYKYHTGRCYELLALLNGNGKGHLSCDKDDKSPECQKSWNDFWEENYYPEEHQKHNEEELNSMCDKAASDQEKDKCREYNLREAEYYNKRAELDIKQDKVVKWQLPVEVDGMSGEYYIQFPDDLMEESGIKEDDLVEWIRQPDDSYLIKKVTTPS